MQDRILTLTLGWLLLVGAVGCKKGGSPVTPGQGLLYYCARELPSGAWQVYRKNLSSGTTDTITRNPAYNYWWVEPSPDHTQLLLLRSPYGTSPDQFNYAQCELIKSTADGTNQQVILPDNANGWYAFSNPHWHPSGNRILLIAQPTSASGPFYVATLDAFGTTPKLLTAQYSLDANWSPTGDKIVFIGLGSTGSVPLNFEVFTATYDYSANQLSAIQQITNDNTRDQDPCFSPDGTTIAFSAGNALGTNADLVSIAVGGENRQTLVDDNGVHGGPINWGADGNIYFHSIYLLSTSFIGEVYKPKSKQYETLLKANCCGYISPYYVSK